MPTQTQQWINIDECIYAYLDASEQSHNKYFKVFNLAFRGMENMGLDFFYQVKSVKLPINSNMTANLPDDCVNYTKIGILNNKGEIIPMAYNNNLTNYADLLPDRVSSVEDSSLFNFYNWGAPAFYNYWNGSLYTTLYGIPSGQPFVGSFKIDTTAGIIVLDPRFAFDYLILEYIASPKEGGEYFVPIQFKEALIAYIAWQDIAYMPPSRKGSLGDKAERKRNFFNERRLANARFKPLYLQEAYEWSLKNQRMVVKS